MTNLIAWYVKLRILFEPKPGAPEHNLLQLEPDSFAGSGQG